MPRCQKCGKYCMEDYCTEHSPKQKKLFSEKTDSVDGDRLNCIKCDNFVDYLDENGLCPQCASSEVEIHQLKTIEVPDFEKELLTHPKTEDCKDSECIFCGYRDCPHHEPLHYHHDGCPACLFEDETIREVEE